MTNRAKWNKGYREGAAKNAGGYLHAVMGEIASFISVADTEEQAQMGREAMTDLRNFEARYPTFACDCSSCDDARKAMAHVAYAYDGNGKRVRVSIPCRDEKCGTCS